jgi:hypothetical protein
MVAVTSRKDIDVDSIRLDMHIFSLTCLHIPHPFYRMQILKVDLRMSIMYVLFTATVSYQKNNHQCSRRRRNAPDPLPAPAEKLLQNGFSSQTPPH